MVLQKEIEIVYVVNRVSIWLFVPLYRPSSGDLNVRGLRFEALPTVELDTLVGRTKVSVSGDK